MDIELHPSEGDGSFSAALAKPKQESSGALVAQQSFFPLLTDETHDEAGDTQKGKIIQFSLTEVS